MICKPVYFKLIHFKKMCKIYSMFAFQLMSSSTDSCMVALTSAYCHWSSKTTVPPPEENCIQPVMDRNQQWLTCAAIEGEAACNSMTNPQCTFENALSVCLLAEPLPVIWLNNITCKDLHYSDMWQDLLFQWPRFLEWKCRLLDQLLRTRQLFNYIYI